MHEIDNNVVVVIWCINIDLNPTMESNNDIRSF